MEGLSLITCRDNISPLPTGSIFSTKEKLLWILCDHLGRIVFVIIQYTIQSVLLNNNKFWACDQYHRKYTESCLQHHWCQWVYCSRKTAETNQQKTITTLQCGTSTALITCFQAMAPFAGAALGCPVSLAACISCFGSHEEPRVTSSVSVVKHVQFRHVRPGTVQVCDVFTAIQ